MKKINILLCVLIAFIAGAVIFYDPAPLYDMITEKPALGFGISWPCIRIFIEPFYAFSYYAQTLERPFYKLIIISWLSWIILAALIITFLKKDSFKKFFARVTFYILGFVSVCVFVAMLPIPGARLWTPEGKNAIDIHSHTAASHDGSVTAKSSLNYFAAHGYSAYFNTEHNHTKGFARFPEDSRFKTVFPGMQISTKDSGISVVLLNGAEFDGNRFKVMHLSEVVSLAKAEGMVVIMPHWWKWKRFSFEQLKNLGIDGFEVYNNGYRGVKGFNTQERKELIDFCQDNDLMMFASTDFHGWGYTTDAWTVVDGSASEHLFDIIKAKPKTELITKRRDQNAGAARFIFEPFSFLYYYLKEAAPKYVIAFALTVIIIYLLSLVKFVRRFFKAAPILFSLLFLGLSIRFYFLWTAYKQTNNIIPDSIIPALFGISVLWFLAWNFFSRKNDENI